MHCSMVGIEKEGELLESPLVGGFVVLRNMVQVAVAESNSLSVAILVVEHGRNTQGRDVILSQSGQRRPILCF